MTPNISSSAGEHRRIAVLGGGLSGLECALTAARLGCQVEVIEPGNQSRTRHVNWDTSKHPGDEKSQSWTMDGWGLGGGLPKRLGGRSLCYHGVFLAVEQPALESWGTTWAARLQGDTGLYRAVSSDLLLNFPELAPGSESGTLSQFGLRHVPQAAKLDQSGLFEAYSPMHALNEFVQNGRIKIIRGRAISVAQDSDRTWDVKVVADSAGATHSGFDRCILASSTIGNVQILASSLRRDILTTITDHFSIGAFVRVPPGDALGPFRHPMLWSGFAELPHLSSNIFFLERPPLENGDRLIEILGVIEQSGNITDYSELSVKRVNDHEVTTHIRANISSVDRIRLDDMRAQIEVWSARLGGAPVKKLTPDANHLRTPVGGRHDGSDARWFSHDKALEVVTRSNCSNVYSEYGLPYGAFEHESCSHPFGEGHSVPISEDLQVLELPGVYVIGPGAFPRMGAANPALTIVAMSRWLGNHLATGA